MAKRDDGLDALRYALEAHTNTSHYISKIPLMNTASAKGVKLTIYNSVS